MGLANGASATFHALLKGRPLLARTLIEQHHFKVNELDAHGNCLLHACMDGNVLDFVTYWMKHAQSNKILVNHQNNNGDTCLHAWTCGNGTISHCKP